MPIKRTRRGSGMRFSRSHSCFDVLFCMEVNNDHDLNSLCQIRNTLVSEIAQKSSDLSRAIGNMALLRRKLKQVNTSIAIAEKMQPKRK